MPSVYLFMHLVRHSPLQTVQPSSLRHPLPTHSYCSFSLISVRAIPSANCPACLLANQSSSVVTVSFALFTPSVLLSECPPRRPVFHCPAVPLSLVKSVRAIVVCLSTVVPSAPQSLFYHSPHCCSTKLSVFYTD